MVACFAAKGHRVIGVDVNERFVRLINEGKPPVSEPGLEDLLKQSAGRLTATTDITEAVRQTDITFMIVPTPSEANGAFSLKYVLAATKTKRITSSFRFRVSGVRSYLKFETLS